MGVEYWRTFDRNRRFLMTGKVGYWWSIQSCSRVDVHRVDHVVGGFRGLQIWRPILTSRREEEASVRSEGEAAEKRSVRLIGVDTCILDSYVAP